MSDLVTKRKEMHKVVLVALQKGRSKTKNFVATCKRIRLGELFEEERVTDIDGWTIPELFDTNQGVTWGGSECKDIYVVDNKVASSIESGVVHKTIGGKDISAFKIKWEGKFLVFPYVKSKTKWIRAFQHPTLGGADALDFSIQLSNYEKGKSIQAKLKYRIAKNVVSFPNAASYLVKHYDKLEQREFEEKTLSQYNKSWYEFHRARTPKLITKPKLVCKRLMRSAAFALDNTGYLPRDSVISMIPKEKLHDLKKSLEAALRHGVTIRQTLHYTLAFLNSEMFQELLEKRRSKKRGGYPIVDERLLQSFTIPRPNTKHAKMIEKIVQRRLENINLRDLCMPSKKRQTKLTTQA